MYLATIQQLIRSILLKITFKLKTRSRRLNLEKTIIIAKKSPLIQSKFLFNLKIWDIRITITMINPILKTVSPRNQMKIWFNNILKNFQNCFYNSNKTLYYQIKPLLQVIWTRLFRNTTICTSFVSKLSKTIAKTSKIQLIFNRYCEKLKTKDKKSSNLLN